MSILFQSASIPVFSLSTVFMCLLPFSFKSCLSVDTALPSLEVVFLSKNVTYFSSLPSSIYKMCQNHLGLLSLILSSNSPKIITTNPLNNARAARAVFFKFNYIPFLIPPASGSSRLNDLAGRSTALAPALPIALLW